MIYSDIEESLAMERIFLQADQKPCLWIGGRVCSLALARKSPL